MRRLHLHRLLTLIALLVFGGFVFGVAASQASDSAPVAQIGAETISLADFTEQAQIVRANLAYMQGQVDAGSANSAYLTRFINLINAHGVENVALATLVQDRALAQLAVARGFAPSEAEANANVEQDKALVAQVGDAAAAAQASIAKVGERDYWTTRYPAIVRRQLATQALWSSVTTGLTNQAERVAAWQQVQRQAIDATPLTILDASAVAPATPSAARAYLDAYWELPVTP